MSDFPQNQSGDQERFVQDQLRMSLVLQDLWNLELISKATHIAISPHLSL